MSKLNNVDLKCAASFSILLVQNEFTFSLDHLAMLQL